MKKICKVCWDEDRKGYFPFYCHDVSDIELASKEEYDNSKNSFSMMVRLCKSRGIEK